MSFQLLTTLLAVLSRNLLMTVATAASSSSTNIPSFSLESLLHHDPLQQQRLHHILTTTGIFQVPTKHTNKYLSTLCDCNLNHSSSGDNDTTSTTLMDDRTTRRSTIATMTVGMEHPLALPKNAAEWCPNTATQNALEELRDSVAHVSTEVMKALDEHQMSAVGAVSGDVLLEDVYGRNYTSLSAISQAANQLEHFHMYHQQQKQATTAEEEESKNTLDWHTDAGLFLAFVPAIHCDSGSNSAKDSSFWFQNEHGEPEQAIFDPNSIVFMMGTGMQHWISTTTETKIKATRHALRIPAGQNRVWYGMMHLVPEHAIVQRDFKTGQATTFQDLKHTLASQDNNNDDDDEIISIGCGHASTHNRRSRRLGSATDSSECNNSTNFFCWMTCMDIPHAEHKEEYLNDDYSLYCLDPSLLDNVADAAAPCATGYIHNPACVGKWKPTSQANGAIPSITSETTQSDEVQYCYGGTSMYMDGFHWIHDTTCTIYLFQSWILNGTGKWVAASIGTVVAAMLLEFILYMRKLLSRSSNLLVSTLLYGLQLTLGYLLMLVIMTYSGLLFVCTILGLMMGHAVWNVKHNLWQRYIIKNRMNAKQYAPGQEKAAATMELQEASLEGATPCCMNGMEDDSDEFFSNNKNDELAA
mmetsp:Transcript_4660/g.6752  ORF Transcript_4660/g.6752 Transcript_4660/m.6752 type:complete len:641 (+) Transcript_4660:93-2015(+)|eukprot:CAMPEP_0194217636 /NCGR_PEP_ID=MMETSP0156-20130528/21865_1 /TAXON_ID=33649 /ORGANISM="Thalassionema nitzschioides, Strain L26-B" /LENGTH=640 /DNA_ID=CAMNT_0038946737 /DNA_START=47 /DNA_END=1969 /DNA_ORIENTATION=+